MFDHKHYVPILKAKEGELKSLSVTSTIAKNNMTPLIEIVKIPWDYKKEIDSKTIENHLTKLPKSLDKIWDKRKVFIDSPFLDGDKKMSDGITHHLSHLFNDFRVLGLNTIPVTSLQRHQEYKEVVRNISVIDSKGICLRLSSSDFLNPNLKNVIDEDLAHYGVNPNSVDLVMDLGSINNAVDLLVMSISIIINSKIPYLENWRTLTLVATSFPENLAGFVGNSISRCERGEWNIWQALLSSNLKRIPSFGDYSISHPDVLDINPAFITMSASIRYTIDNHWIITKGRSVKTQGFGQYHDLSNQLIALPEYCGAAYSWGDNYIDECATRTVNSGNATTWRQVGNNHHFEKVSHQISMLS
jgi:hypothetical protein